MNVYYTVLLESKQSDVNFSNVRSNYVRSAKIKLELLFLNNIRYWCQYTHSSKLNPVNLIDFVGKTKSHEFLHELKANLQNFICELYCQQSDKNIQGELNGQRCTQPFSPIDEWDVCSHCENVFVVRINQFSQEDLGDLGNVQFSKPFAGKRFSDHPRVNYLHLIDYSKKGYDFAPCAAFREHERITFPHVSSFLTNTLAKNNLKYITILFPKLICALKLMNMESSQIAIRFYIKFVKELYAKFRDRDRISKMWAAMFFSDRILLSVLENEINDVPHNASTKLKTALACANRHKYDLYGAWMRGYKIQNFSTCPVTAALLEGNAATMRVLLRYGFKQHLFPKARCQIFFRYISKRCDLYASLLDPIATETGQCPEVREVFMFLMARYVCGQHFKEDLSLKDYCFFLLWSSKSLPIITKQQVEEDMLSILAQFSLQDTSLSYLQKVYHKIVETYDTLPWGLLNVNYTDVETPRTLLELSRCSVRASLAKSLNMPDGVELLPISKGEKNYILLLDDVEVQNEA